MNEKERLESLTRATYEAVYIDAFADQGPKRQEAWRHFAANQLKEAEEFGAAMDSEGSEDE